MKRHNQKNRSQRRGIAAVVFAAALLVVSTLVLWVFQATAVSAQSTLGQLYSNGAFYAAESGVEFSLRELQVNSDLDGDGVIGSISNNGNDADDPNIAACTFHVTYVAGTLTSTGTRQSRVRVVEAVLQ